MYVKRDDNSTDFTSTETTQKIVLTGVDLVTDGGRTFTDAEIITTLLNNDSLNVDT